MLLTKKYNVCDFDFVEFDIYTIEVVYGLDMKYK